MKNKSVVIIGGLSILLIVVAILFMFINPEKKNKDEITYTDYVAYININPQVKLNFKVKCVNKECEEPIVVSHEYLNDDALEVYKDLKIENTTTLENVIEDLINIAVSKEIVFDSVNITTNWYEIEDYMENVNLQNKEINISIDEEPKVTESILTSTTTTTTTSQISSSTTRTTTTKRTTTTTTKKKTTTSTTSKKEEETTEKEETTTKPIEEPKEEETTTKPVEEPKEEETTSKVEESTEEDTDSETE